MTQIRMLWSALFALLLIVLVAAASPQQLPVILYKVALVMLAPCLLYWVDRWLFPYARPDKFLTADGQVMVNHKRVFAAALIRRAIIIGCGMLALGLGL